MTDKDYTSLEAELRADELLYNRGLDYEALRIKPSAKNLAAADAIADLRRERDEVANDRDRYIEGHVLYQQKLEVAEAEAAALRARLESLAQGYEKSWGYDDDLRKGLGMQTTGQVFAAAIRAALQEPQP